MSQQIRLAIAPDLVARFPDLVVGGFMAWGLASRSGALDPSALIAQAREALAKTGLASATITAHPNIAGWRDAYRSQGLKASVHRSSPEALARRVLQDKDIRTPLPMVDLYNAVSVTHLTAMGGYDLARLPHPDIVLRLAKPGTDRFLPLGGDAADMPITESVAVYACSDDVLCWAFNCRDSALTCLTPETDAAFFVAEAVTRNQAEGVDKALADLKTRLQAIGAQVGPVAIADRNAPEITVARSAG